VEVVVADNGSTDYSLAYVRAQHPHVRVLDFGRNLGFAAGYNRALAQVHRPWLALLNNDAAPAPNWLQCLLDYAARHPQAAILGGKLLFGPAQGATGQDRGQPVVQSAGASFTDAGTAFEIGWGQPDQGQFQRPGAVGAIPGAAMLVRREVFTQLGGFDAAYFAYLEDVDLCWRAWLAGHTVHYVPDAVAVHAYGASGGGRLSPFRIRWMQRNRLANMVKNLAAGSLLPGAAVSLGYDAYRVLEYGSRWQGAALRALAAGTFAFWRALPSLLAQRRWVQASRHVSDGELRAQGLLVPTLSAFREYRRLGRTHGPAAQAANRVA
jgi:GT2 family glycosyltransferase